MCEMWLFSIAKKPYNISKT